VRTRPFPSPFPPGPLSPPPAPRDPRRPLPRRPAADAKSVFVSSRSLTSRRLSLPEGRVLRAWKGHSSPVLELSLDPSGALLASASADRTVRVWDVEGGFCTHAFKGHEGIVLSLAWHPDPHRPRLASCGDDGQVRVWGLVERACLHALRDHTSAVTACAFGDGGRLLFTAGRDAVVHCYLADEGRLVGAVATYEPLEGLAVLSAKSRLPGSRAAAPGDRKGSLRLLTAGEQGQLRVWDHLTGEATYEQAAPALKGAAGTYASLLAVPGDADRALVVTGDDRILVVGPGDGADGGGRALPDARGRGAASVVREMVGNVDEVTDVKLLALGERCREHGDAPGAPEPSHVALATSAETVRIHRLSDLGGEVSLVGHSDAVLAIDAFARAAGGAPRSVVASGGKDATVRLWDAETGACLATGEGHMAAVTSVAFAPGQGKVLASVGSDKLLKLWDSGAVLKALAKTVKAGDAAHLARMEPRELRVVSAVAAHDKDVNCVAVAPNDALVATGSQDRTCRLWDVPALTPSLVLRGHKRGVWGVAFSPTDKVVLTSSGDKTMRMWSLRDGQCLRTFEGHNGSVLRACFVTLGTQVLSSGADGTVKIWSASSGECVRTLDEHADRVWALAAGGRGDATVVTGGADAAVRVWEDCTAADELRALQEQQEGQLREQELLNAMHARDFRRAARLAFQVGHPGRLLSVVTAVLAQGPAAGTALLGELCAEFSRDDVKTALGWAREWNTSPRHCHAAQALLGALLRAHPARQLARVGGMSELADGLLTYTRRHLARMARLERATYLLDYTLARMAVLSPDAEAGGADGGGQGEADGADGGGQGEGGEPGGGGARKRQGDAAGSAKKAKRAKKRAGGG